MGVSFWLPLGSYTGMLSRLLWTTPNLGCTPQRGASQDGGEFLATSGELHWDAQPATLDSPKSGLHPDARVRFKMGVSFRRPLGSHTDCGRDARVPRGNPQIWDAPSHRMHPTMGASFWLPLGSYTGMLSRLLWTTPNLGCTPPTIGLLLSCQRLVNVAVVVGLAAIHRVTD